MDVWKMFKRVSQRILDFFDKVEGILSSISFKRKRLPSFPPLSCGLISHAAFRLWQSIPFSLSWGLPICKLGLHELRWQLAGLNVLMAALRRGSKLQKGLRSIYN